MNEAVRTERQLSDMLVRIDNARRHSQAQDYWDGVEDGIRYALGEEPVTLRAVGPR